MFADSVEMRRWGSSIMNLPFPSTVNSLIRYGTPMGEILYFLRCHRPLGFARIFHQEEGRHSLETHRKSGFEEDFVGTVPMPNCTADEMTFGRPGRREIEANFQGGAISSDGGA